MIAIASHFTILLFIIQDLPQVVARIPPLSSELEGLRPFINYDFFTPQPVKGANIMVIGWQFLRTRPLHISCITCHVRTPGRAG